MKKSLNPEASNNDGTACRYGRLSSSDLRWAFLVLLGQTLPDQVKYSYRCKTNVSHSFFG